MDGWMDGHLEEKGERGMYRGYVYDFMPVFIYIFILYYFSYLWLGLLYACIYIYILHCTDTDTDTDIYKYIYLCAMSCHHLYYIHKVPCSLSVPFMPIERYLIRRGENVSCPPFPSFSPPSLY